MRLDETAPAGDLVLRIIISDAYPIAGIIFIVHILAPLNFHIQLISGGAICRAFGPLNCMRIRVFFALKQ